MHLNDCRVVVFAAGSPTKRTSFDFVARTPGHLALEPTHQKVRFFLPPSHIPPKKHGGLRVAKSGYPCTPGFGGPVVGLGLFLVGPVWPRLAAYTSTRRFAGIAPLPSQSFLWALDFGPAQALMYHWHVLLGVRRALRNPVLFSWQSMSITCMAYLIVMFAFNCPGIQWICYQASRKKAKTRRQGTIVVFAWGSGLACEETFDCLPHTWQNLSGAHLGG